MKALTNCFVFCLLMEMFHAISSCCDLIPTEIVSIIFFWSCLLIGMGRSIGFCPDLFQLHRRETFHLYQIGICPDLPKSIVAAIPTSRQPPKAIVVEIPINRQQPKSLEAAIPINREQPKSILAAIPIT